MSKELMTRVIFPRRTRDEFFSWTDTVHIGRDYLSGEYGSYCYFVQFRRKITEEEIPRKVLRDTVKALKSLRESIPELVVKLKCSGDRVS